MYYVYENGRIVERCLVFNYDIGLYKDTVDGTLHACGNVFLSKAQAEATTGIKVEG